MSKRVEALNELRSLTAADLDDHLRQQRRRLFEVRFQQATGQVENHRQIREIRREIARTMTVQLELAKGHVIAPVEGADDDEAAAPKRRRFGRRAAAGESETAVAEQGDAAGAATAVADVDEEPAAAADEDTEA
jgi:large subunit ribosomal protein L29